MASLADLLAIGWLFADWTLVDRLAVLLGHILARLLGHIAALLAGHWVQEGVRWCQIVMANLPCLHSSFGTLEHCCLGTLVQVCLGTLWHSSVNIK